MSLELILAAEVEAGEEAEEDDVWEWHPLSGWETEGCYEVRLQLFEDWEVVGNQPRKLPLVLEASEHDGRLMVIADLTQSIVYGESPHMAVWGHVGDKGSHIKDVGADMVDSLQQILDEYCGQKSNVQISWQQYGKGWGTMPSPNCEFHACLVEAQLIVCNFLRDHGLIDDGFAGAITEFHCSMYIKDTPESIRTWKEYLKSGTWQYVQ